MPDWRSALLLATLALPGLFIASEKAGAAPDRRNILLILTDDQALSEFNAHSMPFLSSRPGSGWITFRNALVNTPMCCPSRATILSGQYSHHTRVKTNKHGYRFDDSATLATWLDAAGY
jgi:N-acetylglucosamine-6-sulfatase